MIIIAIILAISIAATTGFALGSSFGWIGLALAIINGALVGAGAMTVASWVED